MADPACGSPSALGDGVPFACHLLASLKAFQSVAASAVAEVLGEVGLTTQQFLLLAHIQESPDISSAELARRSYVSPQSMIAMVAKLESAGLIVRAPSEVGRSLHTRLTPKGEQVLSAAARRATAIEDYLRDALGEDDFERLRSLMQRGAEALGNASAVTTRRRPWSQPAAG